MRSGCIRMVLAFQGTFRCQSRPSALAWHESASLFHDFKYITHGPGAGSRGHNAGSVQPLSLLTSSWCRGNPRNRARPHWSWHDIFDSCSADRVLLHHIHRRDIARAGLAQRKKRSKDSVMQLMPLQRCSPTGSNTERTILRGAKIETKKSMLVLE